MSKLKALFNQILLNKKITSNIGWLLLDKFARLGLNFILTTWLARYLGKEAFGLWNYAIAFVALFSVSTTLGLYNILLKDYVNKTFPLNQLLGSAFFIKLIGGGFTVLLSYVSMTLINPDAAELHELVMITGFGYMVQSIDVIDYYFQSQLKARFTIIARVIAFGVISTCKIYGIFEGYSLEYFVWLTFLELLIAAIFLIFIFQLKENTVFLWSIRFDVIKHLLWLSFPLMLAELAIIIYMKIDQFMLGEFINHEEVGEYAAAAKLSEIWYLFPNIICTSLFPSISESYKTDKKIYYKKLQFLYDIMAALSITISIVVMFSSEFMINLFYGTEYQEASHILSIHVWAGVFVFLGMAGSQQLLIENLMKITFYKTLIGMFANVILNIILIPKLQSEGAALSTLLSYGIAAFLADAFFIKTRKVFWFKLKALNFFRWLKI